MVERNQGTVSSHELSEIRALIEQRSGIHFDDSRERFLIARVREHMSDKRMLHGTDLMRLIRGSNVEYDALVERLLTQETSFFRYPAVFAALERKVLPELHMKKFWENPRSLRIWSAGCASGEEPYSVAITLAESLEFADAWNIHILATDISKQALQHAERGVYPRRELASLDLRQLENYFVRVGDQFMVKPRIRNMVSFAPVNLANGVYMGRFDCIFCMNVLIYFTEERRSQVIQRFYDYLEPGGYLFLGHSESVARLPVNFETTVAGDCLLYQRPNSSVARRSNAAAARESL
ncbi:MAG TPA: protein-glutamate O-methyltransferase CheR [Terriglobales bacterium]|nr:protein-glutamate O-methyltransferase CheR [Terriglobales bacterium]